MQKGAVIPLFYLPPIEYFSILKRQEEPVLVEKFEHFPKQTYRNRACIHSPNNKLNLIVPIIKGSDVHTRMKDVRISYESDWQRLHWMSLQTAYRSSAYFEFYEDQLAGFYHKKYDFLFDYNLEITELLCSLLKLKPEMQFTEEYVKEYPHRDDYRSSIHPKQESNFVTRPYFQVFEDRNGFLPNLSIIDLLFSQGPQSGSYL